MNIILQEWLGTQMCICMLLCYVYVFSGASHKVEINLLAPVFLLSVEQDQTEVVSLPTCPRRDSRDHRTDAATSITHSRFG